MLPPTSMPGFPAAGACAELLLADQKDAVYEGEVKNQLREVLERVCGAHLLSQLLPELTALSSVLYFAVVLGHKQPQQTLGEEFCDVLRVVKPNGDQAQALLVPWPRHLVWLALAVVPRYLTARSQSGWLNLVQLTRSPRERMEQQLRNRQADRTAGDQKKPVVHRALTAMDASVSRLKRFLAWVESDVMPATYEFTFTSVQQWMAQCHLAGFYVFAKYFHVSKRLAAIQYLFVRQQQQQPINLSLLGYTMFLRLFVTAFVEAKRLRGHHKQQKRAALQAEGARGDAGFYSQSDRVPTSFSVSRELEDNSKPASQLGSSRSKRKCALCLGDRIAPAATPCGHVFCWECIVGWCQKNKAECPLCRQEAHPQQIKCMYNYA